MQNLSVKIVLSVFIIFSNFIFNISYALEESVPSFECTLTDTLTADGEPGKAKKTFTPETPKIYFICYSDEVEKGEIIKAEWIAADTNKVAPDNYKIDDSQIEVKRDLKGEEQYTASFSMSKPDRGWPIGSYHVDVYVDDELSQSTKFAIK